MIVIFLRFCFFVLSAFSSLYCLMAFLPFTYGQVIKANVIPALTSMAQVQPWLLIPVWILLSLSLYFESKGKPARKPLLFCILFSSTLFTFQFFFLSLAHLPDNESSLIWAFLFLIPTTWIGCIDLYFVDTAELYLTRQGGKVLVAAFLSALISSSLFAFAYREPWLASALCLLVVASVIASAINLGAGLKLPHVGFVFFSSWAIGLILKEFVFSSLSFLGWQSYAYALAVALAITLLIAQIIRLGPPQIIWKILVALLLCGLPFFSAQIVSQNDWNFLGQQMLAIFSCSGLFLILFLILRKLPMELNRFEPVFYCVSFLILAGFGAFASSIQSHSNPKDAAFRVTQKLLIPAKSDASFYRFLAENTNLPRHLNVPPVEIDLATAPSLPGAKPNIFIIVVDSLRRDYLQPYNSKVPFTPSIEKFAQESIVFKNAFTRYGATGLSEPSIWAGSMLLHKQYVAPFFPENSLQKLIQSEKYRALVSVDSILQEILKTDANLLNIDEGISTQDFDLCKTLPKVVQQLNADSKNTFVYTQPQNIHISVLAKNSLPQDKFPGFHSGYSTALKRLDGCFGEFISELKRLNLYKDSIVILTSDHGDSLGEEGRFGHAYTIFPEILKIPLIIHLPEDLLPKLSWQENRLAFLTDITPTIYKILSRNPSRLNRAIGRPLFQDKGSELLEAESAESSNLVVSSYGPVYGILNSNGSSLYISDGVNFQDYLFHLDGEKTERLEVDSQIKGKNEAIIRAKILELNEIHHFKPSR